MKVQSLNAAGFYKTTTRDIKQSGVNKCNITHDILCAQKYLK